MANSYKVLITSCETGEGAWTTHQIKLNRLYELSDKCHALVTDPEEADLILVGNVREEEWGEKILRQQLINHYPKKSFSLSDRAAPLILHHGIYTNSSRSIPNFGRIGTGCYTLYPDECLNPYVNSHRYPRGGSVSKEYLMTFLGRNCHRTRKELFNLKFTRPDIHVEDSSLLFDLWNAKQDAEKLSRQEYYYLLMLRSKFSLCPRGVGTNSIRLFESMQLGVAPIVISDAWIPPIGPRWSEFAIFVKERHLRDVERIAQDHESHYKEMGRLARKAYDEYFAEDVYFNYIVETCINIKNNQLIPEILFWKCKGLIIFALKFKDQIRLRTRIRNLLQSNR